MEHPQPEGVRPRFVVRQGEAHGEDRRRHGFDREGYPHDAQHEGTHILDAEALDLGGCRELGPQGEFADHGDADHGGEGHHPEPADLDEREDHDLPEAGPMGGCIDHDQARHAQRRDRGEERLYDRRPAGSVGRGRMQERDGAEERDDGEREEDGTCRPWAPVGGTGPVMTE